MDNTIGFKAELSIKFKKELEDALKLPVYLQDERLTTKQAQDVLISNDTSRKKRKKVIDSMAACIILQSYLDKENKNGR
jgi:putative Holliday junction resolvase